MLKYKYDEKGEIIDETVYDSNEKIISKDSIKYDENGNCIESIKYETNIWNGRDFTQISGEYISKAVNKFDPQGNIIENIYFYYNKFNFEFKFGSIIEYEYYK